MSLGVLSKKTKYWTEWVFKEEDTDTFAQVEHEIFERLWLCTERFDESNNNHEFVILANLFGEEIYTGPWPIYSMMCEYIVIELRNQHDLFETYKLVYTLFRLDSKLDLPETKNVQFVKKIISEACNFENDSKTFDAMKMLKEVYLKDS